MIKKPQNKFFQNTGFILLWLFYPPAEKGAVHWHTLHRLTDAKQIFVKTRHTFPSPKHLLVFDSEPWNDSSSYEQQRENLNGKLDKNKLDSFILFVQTLKCLLGEGSCLQSVTFITLRSLFFRCTFEAIKKATACEAHNVLFSCCCVSLRALLCVLMDGSNCWYLKLELHMLYWVHNASGYKFNICSYEITITKLVQLIPKYKDIVNQKLKFCSDGYIRNLSTWLFEKMLHRKNTFAVWSWTVT